MILWLNASSYLSLILDLTVMNALRVLLLFRAICDSRGCGVKERRVVGNVGERGIVFFSFLVWFNVGCEGELYNCDLGVAV